jgi:spermidine synthase
VKDTASIRLPSGSVAEFAPDPFRPDAVILSIDGVVQSHVSTFDPRSLAYDYVRRMGHAVDLVAPPAAPLTVLQLGAGALTLARYVAATRPGSVQYVVEAQDGLFDFVLTHVPLPAGSRVQAVVADALDGLHGLAPRLRGTVDVVVCDVYAGLSTPSHLATPAFYGEVAELLSPAGIVLVNVVDEADLALTRAQSEALSAALPFVVIAGPTGLLDGSIDGNAVLIASRSDVTAWIPALIAAGPHPAAARLLSSL